MRLEDVEEVIDASEKTIIDDALVFQSFDLVLSLSTLLMDLVLLRSNERFLVDIGMDFNIRVIAEL